VTIGGIKADVLWAAKIWSGWYELSVTVPKVASGDQVVQATIAGFQSPATALIPIAAPKAEQ
jgi:uncharacterized protein (TIGR03437 family)